MNLVTKSSGVNWEHLFVSLLIFFFVALVLHFLVRYDSIDKDGNVISTQRPRFNLF